MVRVAVIHDMIGAQMDMRSKEMENIEVVYKGSNVEELMKKADHLKPQVVVLDLDHLGEEPMERLQEVHDKTGSHLTLVVYNFAKREVLKSLDSGKARLLKSPVTWGMLRMNMLSLIVGDVLGKGGSAEANAAVALSGGSEGNGDALKVGTPKQYTLEQLGRLQEITSAVDCECPNHLSGIVSSLSAFEDYSYDCENKNEEDAKIHRHLYEQTSKARHMMEQALTKLCEFENISLNKVA